ncbi:hypothetical protein NDU88_004671 [Pleurodeles waltl]|uniref:Uncharacterized protein n=1 Tax=Pleurodeles waltl TaxID=8319 RepID=A0AAV7PD86_PLEWA|nr:hypothetical protein NDU88_004671 [Pleurodeles waltl]
MTALSSGASGLQEATRTGRLAKMAPLGDPLPSCVVQPNKRGALPDPYRWAPGPHQGTGPWVGGGPRRIMQAAVSAERTVCSVPVRVGVSGPALRPHWRKEEGRPGAGSGAGSQHLGPLTRNPERPKLAGRRLKARLPLPGGRGEVGPTIAGP